MVAKLFVEGALGRPIYLDNHATTACDPGVVDGMLPYFTERFGNSSSRTHVYGHEAKAAVEVAREQVAQVLGARPKEIIWTSGATESNNLAVLGAARANQQRGRHIVTTNIEHPAVLDTCEALQKEEWQITQVAVQSDGLVSLAAIERALRPDTTLVSVMLANNEIGTLQPIADIGELCRERGVLFHTDAAQAIGKVAVDVSAMHIDLLSLTAHKMHGPKGVGALFVRSGRPRVKIQPLLFGGGQERGLRSGTQPVPLLVALGKTCELAHQALHNGEVQRYAALRDRLWDGIKKGLRGVEINGSGEHRLPNNLNISIDDVETGALMLALRGVACSAGSACSSGDLKGSRVLKAIGANQNETSASLRFGLGRFNTQQEIDAVIELVVSGVQELRALRRTVGL